MKVTYMAGMAEHLLKHCEHPAIKSVSVFEEPAGRGVQWPRHVLRVELVDGSALLVAFVRTSSPEEDKTLPDFFKEEDLERIARSVPSMRVSHVG